MSTAKAQPAPTASFRKQVLRPTIDAPTDFRSATTPRIVLLLQYAAIPFFKQEVVRRMVVKGKGGIAIAFIPLTNIPLTRIAFQIPGGFLPRKNARITKKGTCIFLL
jgi:hypothetical protein